LSIPAEETVEKGSQFSIRTLLNLRSKYKKMQKKENSIFFIVERTMDFSKKKVFKQLHV